MILVLLGQDGDARPNADATLPQAVVDAGGVRGAALAGAIDRCMQDLPPGQVIEVISEEPAARLEVPEWCRITGHILLRSLERGVETLFWIRKGPRPED